MLHFAEANLGKPLCQWQLDVLRMIERGESVRFIIPIRCRGKAVKQFISPAPLLGHSGSIISSDEGESPTNGKM